MTSRTPLRRTVAAIAASCIAATLVTFVLPAPPAAAAAPTRILNNGGQNSSDAQWMETQSVTDGGNVRLYVATFLVEHAANRRITQALADLDWASDVDANTSVAFSEQHLGTGTTNQLETSRVTVSFTAGVPGVNERNNFPIRFRLVDDIGGSTATVSANLHVVDESNCCNFIGIPPDGSEDFPRLTAASQTAVEVAPSTNITYNFTCDDVDITGQDDCDRANIRWRRLNDGTTSAVTLKTGISDNTGTSHTMSFPSRGYYVVEAQLGNEGGGFPDTGNASGGWWRLGNAVVNDAASSLSGSIAFTGASASPIPSVNEDIGTLNAVATVDDNGAGGVGHVQIIEWDPDGNGTFNTPAYSVPTLSGGDVVHADVSTSQRTQGLSTSTPGLVTVQARITDSGAFDAAENIRRQLTFSQLLRINARPTASTVNTSTNEDNAVTVTMVGNDTDGQPAPLVYEIVTPPSASTGTLGPISGNQVTFTPALNYNGPASFVYRVRDGGPSTVAAWTTSANANVNITVNSVNDLPTVDPKSATTNEDNSVDMQATGSDVEGPLTWTVASQPTNGSASCVLATGLCTYSPNGNFFGSDSFVVRGTDTNGATATATFSVTVNPVNDAPIANDQTVTVAEDAINFGITLSAGDVDSSVLSFIAPIDDVDHGTIQCAGNACLYTPTGDYNGPDSFTFEVSDGLLTDIGQVTINVTPVNDAPVATDVPDAVADEDIVESLTLGGTDVDLDPVTVSGVTDPPNGSATQTGPNTADYLGDLNFNGIDTFDFTVTDSNGGFDTGTVTVTVNPVNDAPEVDDQSFSTDEDTPFLISAAAGDVDGDALSWSVVTPPTNGQLTGSGPDIGYAPALHFNGTDTFVVQVDDGNGGIDTAIITVDVAAVNDQPDAKTVLVTVSEDSNVNFSLDADDVDGDTLTYTAPASPPSNGVALCTGADCSYTPTPGFHGSDVFTYAVADGNGGFDNASVVITVTSVNDEPLADDDSVTTAEDAPVAVTLSAFDPDGDVLSYSTSAPTSGTVEGVAPDVVYVPGTNFNGTDSFDFTVNDGNGGTATATIDITVAPVNDAPVATGGTEVTPEETEVSFQLGANDVEGDPLTFTVTGAPGVGSLSCDTAGACSYTPATDFSGAVTIAYDVSDGAAFDSGVFTVFVDPRNDPPTADDQEVMTPEDTALTIELAASDTEGDPLTYGVAAPPAHGTLLCSTDGISCVYTPGPNYNGADTFQWSADDGNTGSVTATVDIVVSAVNDAPEALDTSAATDEESSVGVPLLASDAEGDAIAFSIVSGPSNGTIAVSGSTATYTPAVDFEGLDTFRYRAIDPSGAFTEANGSVVVAGAPLIATRVIADAVTVQVKLKNNSLNVAILRPIATLREVGGPVLPGRAIDFYIGDRFICTGITRAGGQATCSSTLDNVIATLNLGYRAVFTGDADHTGSSDLGALIGVQVQG